MVVDFETLTSVADVVVDNESFDENEKVTVLVYLSQCGILWFELLGFIRKNGA